MYRETAFMYSLATSAFMYVVAQACVEGKLSNCQCAGHPKSDNPLKWDWGGIRVLWILWKFELKLFSASGCSVNTKHASSFVEKFLQLKRKGDNPSNIMKYNSEVGLQITRHNTKKVCKCHGLSGKHFQHLIYRVFICIAENIFNSFRLIMKVATYSEQC